MRTVEFLHSSTLTPRMVPLRLVVTVPFVWDLRPPSESWQAVALGRQAPGAHPKGQGTGVVLTSGGLAFARPYVKAAAFLVVRPSGLVTAMAAGPAACGGIVKRSTFLLL